MPNAKFTTLLNQVSNTDSTLEACVPHIHHLRNKEIFRGVPSGGYLNEGEFAKIKPLVDNQNIYQVVTSYPNPKADRYYEHTDGDTFYGGTIRTEVKFTDRKQHYLFDNNTLGRFNPKPLVKKKSRMCVNFKVRPVNNIFHENSNRAKVIFQIFPQPHSTSKIDEVDYVKITKTSDDEYLTNYPEPFCQILFAKNRLWLKLNVGSYVDKDKEKPLNAKFYLNHPQGDPDIKGKSVEEVKKEKFVRAWHLKDFSDSINEHKGSDQWTDVWLTVDPDNNYIECSVDNNPVPRIKFKGNLHKPYYVIHNNKNTKKEITDYGYFFKSGLVTTLNKDKPESETMNNIVWISDLFIGDSYNQIRQYHKQPDSFDMRVFRSSVWDYPDMEERDKLYKKLFIDPQKAWEERFNKA